MELHLGLIRPGEREHRCVTVDADAAHTVADLCDALDAPALTVVRTGRELTGDQLVATADLRSGDDVVAGRDADVGRRRRRDRAAVTSTPEQATAELAVVVGPESGRSFPLAPGRHSLGRSRLADVRVDDASVSRHHLDVVVAADGSVTLCPNDEAGNGVTVDGLHVIGDTSVASDRLIRVGATGFVLRPPPCRAPGRPCGPASHRFRRAPYRPSVVRTGDAVPIGPIPQRPSRRRLGLLGALIPLVAGGAMFVVTGQVTFLALTLLSPLIMIGSVIEDRRLGRRTWKHDLAEFRARLADGRSELQRRAADERAARLAAAPDLAELVHRAEHLSSDLWARTATAPDALHLRLGLGRDEVQFSIELAPGGDAGLRTEAEAAIAPLRVLDDVPITIDLASSPVLALHGDGSAVERLAAALVAQVAVLHGPTDVAMVVAAAPGRGLAWTQWLPHTRAGSSPISGPHLADDTDGIDAVVSALTDVVARRRAPPGTPQPGGPWPRVVAVLDGALDPDPVGVARLLEEPIGVSVVWICESSRAVPHQAGTIVEVGRDAIGAAVARSWSTDPAVEPLRFGAEQLGSVVATQIGRALAPVDDVSVANRANAIPHTIPLREVIDSDPVGIAAHWHRSTGDGLRFALGPGVDGPVVVDLVADGPHALVGGTSGAGKSELLQSIVAALATAHPPARLNFLFVDFKGGAAMQAFARLPHGVGHVTDLTNDLAERALVSLRAELRRRMALLEGRAKDVDELRAIDADVTPPSLVIVVDEFATLVHEVPEFMAGVVDLAQRGRSLGIHLVLATQRPSGAVDENILANTNLRLSLRVLDRADSIAILDSPVAAEIAVARRGRGVVRLGPGRLVEFQGPWASAPAGDDDTTTRPVRVAPFGFEAARRRSADTPDHGRSAPSGVRRTQLDELVDAVVAAGDRSDHAPPRRPWCEPLPDRIDLSDLLGTSGLVPSTGSSVASSVEHGDDERDQPAWAPGRHVPVGLADEPDRQRQTPVVVDLAAGAAMAVGAARTGRSTFVRTVVAAVGAMATPADPAVVLVVDMAGRDLTDLAELPHVSAVAVGDDLEAITRHLIAIDRQIAARRRSPPGGPPTVVCIDGFDALVDTLLDPGSVRDAERWLEVVTRLLIDGRQVGIGTVLTASRRGAVPARLQAAIAHRLVLRQHEPAAYADLGLPSSLGEVLASAPAGRCVLDGRLLAQVATAGDPVRLVAGAPRASALSVTLPDDVPLADVAPTCGAVDRRPVVGVSDVSGDAVRVDLTWDDLVVCGPTRSGRSTALLTVAGQLAGAHGAGTPVVAVRSGRHGGGTAVAAGGAIDAIEDVLDDPSASVVVIDDVDLLDDVGDPRVAAAVDRLARRDDLRLVGALDVRSATGYAASPLVARLRRARRILVLRPDDAPDLAQLVGRPIRLRPGLRRVPGRGVLVTDDEHVVLQVPRPTPLRPGV